MAKRRRKQKIIDETKDDSQITLSKLPIKQLRKHLPYLVLAAILLFAASLRAYHLDYPVIGYHNWKATHYLTEARNFARDGLFQAGFFVPVSDLPYLYADPSGAHPDTFPMTSIITGIAFSVFGSSIVVARVINLLFGLGAIVAMFFLVRMLFRRNDIALTAAFIAAINPLFIYFSHNVQLDNTGVFFMLMTPIFFLKWIKNYDMKNALLTTIFFVLAVLSKFTFALIAVPLLFIFPYNRLREIPKKWKIYVPCMGVMMLIPLWIYYANVVLTRKFNVGAVGGGLASVNLSAAFSQQTWNSLKAYFGENYGVLGDTFLIGAWLAFAGAVLLIVFLLLKKGSWKHLENRFLLGYIIGTIPWFFVMAEKLQGHSYHQYPVAPLFIMLAAYIFLIISINVEGLFLSLTRLKRLKGIVRYVPIVLLMLLIYAPSMESKSRMFDTQFRGVDIAGEYIREHSTRNERFFHSSHQSFGSIWHADRVGYRPPQNLSELKWAEENLNVTWLFLYQWGLYGGISYIPTLLQMPDVAEYISETYSLRQIGFEMQQGQWAPSYFLFRKGGSTNLSDLNSVVGARQIQIKEYDYSFGKVQFGYINID